MAIKITVGNIKGGVGKTTTVLNLADQLMARGKKVLVVDADPQRSSTLIYGAEMEGKATIYDVIFEGCTFKDAVQTTTYGDIVPSDVLLRKKEQNIDIDTRMYKYFKKACKGVEKDYDYILFDTSPKGGILLGNALMCSDYLLIPVECEVFGMEAITDILSIYDEYTEDNDKLKLLGILRIKYKESQILTKKVNAALPEILKGTDAKIFNTTIREAVACKEAMALQMRLTEYAPTSTVCEDYSNLADEIIQEVEN